MTERYFNWHGRPAVIRDTSAGGLEALFVQTNDNSWSKAHPVEVLESGQELPRSTFMEMFPNAPRLVAHGDVLADAGPELEGDRSTQKAELLRRGFSNARAEAWLDRAGYPRPPGWHSVFFYPDGMRPRNACILWLIVVVAITVWVL